MPSPKEYYAGSKTIPIKAFPNPVNGGEITFEFENTEHLPPSVPPNGGKFPSLNIYNVYGEKVHEERVYRYQGESKVNVQNWKQGIYVALIFSKGQIAGQTKFVVQ